MYFKRIPELTNNNGSSKLVPNEENYSFAKKINLRFLRRFKSKKINQKKTIFLSSDNINRKLLDKQEKLELDKTKNEIKKLNLKNQNKVFSSSLSL